LPGYIVSIALISMIVLIAFTVTASIIRVLPVSRSIAPWMFKRWRPLVCSIATSVSSGPSLACSLVHLLSGRCETV
jgi:pantothenate kinase-related protein Tda10